MIDRSLFCPQQENPPWPVPLTPTCTVPTEGMAYMLADLLNTCGDVLEIGTGSGYQTAVLAERCRSVVSVEINPQNQVQQKLPSHVVLFNADGCIFHTDNEFDGILVTFGANALYDVWHRQLKEGGRLVVPLKMGDATCQISVYEKRNGLLQLIDAVAYAPFTGEVRA